MSGKHTRVLLGLGIAILVVAVVVVVLIVGAGSHEPRNTRPTEPAKKPDVRKLLADLSAPTITGLRQPGHDVSVSWSLDRRFDPVVLAFTLRRFTEADSWIELATDIPSSTRSWLDTRDKQDGAVVSYRVVLHASDGRKLESEMAQLIWHDRPVPKAPRDLRGRWTVVSGVPHVLLTWTGGDDAGAGYVVYADDREQGLLEEKQVSQPLRVQRWLCPVANHDDREVTFAVAAVNSAGQESPRSQTRVRCPAGETPAPTAVRARLVNEVQDGSHRLYVQLEWDYRGQAGLRGFRISKNGLPVASESRLGPELRSWKDPILVPGKTAVYAVAAVSSRGLPSPASEAAPFSVSADDPAFRPRPLPRGVEWYEHRGEVRIRLRWDKDVFAAVARSYEVEYDRTAQRGRFAALPGTLPKPDSDGAFEWIFPPPAGLRAYAFRVRAVEPSGAAGDWIELSLPAPSELLPRAQLFRFKQIEGSNGTRRLAWRWHYPDSMLLRGFRLYHDDKLVAGEQTLGRAARSWTSPSLTRKGKHRFRLEAVAIDGKASESSSDFVYVVD